VAIREVAASRRHAQERRPDLPTPLRCVQRSLTLLQFQA